MPLHRSRVQVVRFQAWMATTSILVGSFGDLLVPFGVAQHLQQGDLVG